MESLTIEKGMAARAGNWLNTFSSKGREERGGGGRGEKDGKGE